jgi:tetratricopeptide (TPR) repeat protein
MISLRIACRKFPGALALTIAIAAFSQLSAVAEPTAKTRKGAAKKGEPTEAVPKAAPASAGNDFADAWPTSVPGAPDLELRPDGARKAEALVAYAQGNIAESSADTEKALAHYRRVLELDPGAADLAVQVAGELTRRGDPSGAIQVLKDCVKAAPNEPMPLVLISQVYSRHLKKTDVGLKYAEQALAIAPTNYACHAALYELHVAANETKQAEAVLERAAKAADDNGKFLVQVADLFRRQYLKDDGTAQPDDLQKMNAVYRRVGELAGNDSEILAQVADYFVLSRQVKEAIPFYLKAIADPSQWRDSGLNETRDKLARAFIITQQRDEAIGVLEQLAKETPTRFVTFEMLGELYEQSGDFDKAVRNYQQSLMLDASQAQNYLRLNAVLLRKKQPERAVEIMRQARARFRDVPQVTINYAIALSQAKRHTDAMTVFAEAQAEAQSSHEELLNATFYFYYGAAAEQAGLIDKAADLLKRCIALDASNAAEAYNYLGYMWADRGENLDEAGEMIRKALEIEPDNGAYLDSLGWFHFKKGEHDKALKQLLRAAEVLKLEDSVVYDHIADTYQALGKTAEAVSYWQKALALAADDKVAAGKISDKLEAAKQKVTSKEPPARE